MSEPAPPLLRAESLRKVYADGKVTALDGVSLTVDRGEYVAIMGESGSGKSTLLNLLGALDLPTEGEVYVEGEPLSKMASLDLLRARKVGFVFQSFLLLPALTAVANVQLPMLAGPIPPAARAGRARELLRLARIDHRADHRPVEMSIGERQRVAIARALANDPPLVLADEPTGSLDSRTTEEVLELFGQLNQEHGKTLIVVTHSADVAAHARRVITVKDGAIAADRRA